MIVEAREQVVTMTAPAPGGLSKIHYSRGLWRCNVLTIILYSVAHP
jgi:hypothetical protein